jgi:hypothetical protein
LVLVALQDRIKMLVTMERLLSLMASSLSMAAAAVVATISKTVAMAVPVVEIT